MQRLMGIRIWAYVATRSDWVENPQLWRTRTRTIEDTLSDLLHERLAARFVDKRATSLARRLEEADSKPLLSAITRTGEVSVEGHAVGTCRALRLFRIRMPPGQTSLCSCGRPAGRPGVKSRAVSPTFYKRRMKA